MITRDDKAKAAVIAAMPSDRLEEAIAVAIANARENGRIKALLGIPEVDEVSAA